MLRLSPSDSTATNGEPSPIGRVERGSNKALKWRSSQFDSLGRAPSARGGVRVDGLLTDVAASVARMDRYQRLSCG